MAKPLELAYSQVWNRKSIETLNATEIGAYICLTRAMILNGHDPLPTDFDTQQRLARLTRIQWAKYRERITAALNDTVGYLKKSYAKAEYVKQWRVDRSVVAREALRRKRELAAKTVIVDHSEFSDADQYAAWIIQPHLAARYNPNNYDKQARNAAKSNTKPAATLTD